MLCLNRLTGMGWGVNVKEKSSSFAGSFCLGFLLAQHYSVFLLIQEQLPLASSSRGPAVGRWGGDRKCEFMM